MLDSLIHSSLKITSEDRVCILSDKFRKSTADAIVDVLNGNVHIETIHNRCLCNDLPSNIRDILLGERFNVIIICIEREQDIWHSKERSQAKYALGKRLASVIVPYDYFKTNGHEENIPLIKQIGNYIWPCLKPQVKIHIKSEAGTDITAMVGERAFCENGDYSMPHSGGDFPYGETGFAPEPYTVEGTLVYDLKVQHMGLTNPGDIILTIKRDKIIDIGGSKSQDFKDLICQNDILYYISEISFGINPFIKVLNNTTNIVEEKKAGTVHFGHGGNSAYGARIGPHFDAVIMSPTVFVDRSLFIKNGRYLSKGMSQELRNKLRDFNLISDED